jgi:hypothetical protein
MMQRLQTIFFTNSSIGSAKVIFSYGCAFTRNYIKNPVQIITIRAFSAGSFALPNNKHLAQPKLFAT